MKKDYIFLFFSVLFFGLNAQILSEDFDDVDTLFTRPTNQWKRINFSTNNSGNPAWFNPNSGVFPAFNGNDSSFIGSNYFLGTGESEISGILFTPVISIKNGDTLSFYTRVPGASLSGGIFPDRLIIRINTIDAGADSASDLGDGRTYLNKYDSVLLDINPTYSADPYPVGMPIAWTKVTVLISKLTGANARPSRIAFHNYNLDGGPDGTNGDYIGIDALRITSASSGSTIIDLKPSDKFSIYPNPANNFVFVKSSDNSAITASVLSIDGKILKTEVLRSEGKMNIENLAPGFYNLKIENGSEVTYKKITKK